MQPKGLWGSGTRGWDEVSTAMIPQDHLPVHTSKCQVEGLNLLPRYNFFSAFKVNFSVALVLALTKSDKIMPIAHS